MKNFFNTLEFDKANDLKWKNPELSLKLFKEYFNNYPYDYTSYPYYIDLLINVGQINKARDIKNKVLKMVANDYRFKNRDTKMLHFEYGMVYNEIRLLILDKEYAKAIDYLNRYGELLKEIATDFTTGGTIFYCQKQLGLLDLNDRDSYSYLFRQIIEYREEDFINHVKKHLCDRKEDNPCVFSDDFPFEKVFQEIKKFIPSNKKMRSGFFDDKYYFRFDNCGRSDNKLTDYFEVVTMMDSDHLITMFPMNVDCSNLLCEDLNHLKEEDKILTKKISQIDKFNQRYHR